MSAELTSGTRVRLTPTRRGFWGAQLWGPFYLGLNDGPTGTVVALERGRDPAGDQVIINIDGQPEQVPLRAWSIARGLVELAEPGERRPAAIVDGQGQAVEPARILEWIQAGAWQAEQQLRTERHERLRERSKDLRIT